MFLKLFKLLILDSSTEQWILSFYDSFMISPDLLMVIVVAQWLRCCVTNRKVAGSISVGDRGSTVVKVLCYKSEGRWFDLCGGPR